MESKYIQSTLNGKRMREHRKVWTLTNGPIPDGMQIHHINNNKQDNRIENLKLVTQQENRNSSDCWGKGYVKHGNKFTAQRKVFGKYINLGGFYTECGAYMASRMAYITHGL